MIVRCVFKLYFYGVCYFLVHCILESRVNGPDGKVGLGIIIISILWVLGIFMDSYYMIYMHPFWYIHAIFHCHLSSSLIIVIIIRLLIVIMDGSRFMGPDDSLCYLRSMYFSLWVLDSSVRYGCWIHFELRCFFFLLISIYVSTLM